MILMKNIIKEGNELLRKKSADVTLPLSNEDKTTILEMLGYLFNSQNDQKAKELGLRPGVGIAAPQIGINKNMFAILCNDMEGKTWLMAVINPKIVKKSKELVFLPGGEGCLSVDRCTDGLVTPRHNKITLKSAIYDFNTKKIKNITLNLEGYPAIVIQHEYDHLDGILFTDKMYKEDEINASPLYVIEEEE